jgi:hypothetical protein
MYLYGCYRPRTQGSNLSHTNGGRSYWYGKLSMTSLLPYRIKVEYDISPALQNQLIHKLELLIQLFEFHQVHPAGCCCRYSCFNSLRATWCRLLGYCFTNIWFSLWLFDLSAVLNLSIGANCVMFFLVFYSQMFSAACPISYSSEHELCVFSLYCFFW